MTTRLSGFLSTIALAAGLAVAGPLHAQDVAKATTPPTVAGTWTMTVMSHQVGMVLAQDGTKISGTLMMMGTDVPVEGEFIDGMLSLTSNARVMNGPPSTDEPGHGGAGPQGSRLTVKARLQDDGTLAGEMPGRDGQPLTWIADRLKERKLKPSPAARASGPGVTGAWKMTASSPQGAMQFDLTLKQDGDKVTGILSSDHAGELVLEGTITHGTMKFVTGGSGPDAMHLEYSATLKDDGTLAGELSGAKVASMAWTAERVKK